MQDDEGHVNWGVLLFSLLCIACGAVWLGLLRTWCALGSSCLSCPRRQRQVSAAPLSVGDKMQAHIALLHVCGRQRQVSAALLSVSNKLQARIALLHVCGRSSDLLCKPLCGVSLVMLL